MATLASMTVRLGIDTDRLAAGAARAKKILTGVGKAVTGLGVGVPVAAAAAAAVGGMAAAAASAGAAYQAFRMAAAPQMEAVRSVSELAAAAEEAAAEGGEKAAEAQKAYADALGKLPKATQATAKEFIGLKKDQEAWSDSLASSTMPVYTKGIQLLRKLLPLLTPLVKAAAGVFTGFLDDIGKGLEGGGPKKFAEQLAETGGKNLKSFLGVLKNIGSGLAGLFKAFLPVSTGMSGGLERLTKNFADWGQSLEGSEGFEKFLSLSSEGGQTLGALAMAVGKLLVALGPLIGITTTIALHLAEMINALPPSAVKALATAIGLVVVGMKLYKVGAAGVALGNRLMASSTYLAIAGWARMTAAGLMAYARIGAAAVVSAARTGAAWVGSALVSIGTWIAAVVRAAVTAVAQFALMAARAIAWAAVMAAQWLIAMGPIGWIILAVIALVALVIANWDKVKAGTVAAWNAVVSKVKGAGAAVVSGVKGAVSSALAAWNSFKAGVVTRAAGLVTYVKGIPGKIKSALGSLGSLLTGAGRSVVQGLWSGIKAMGGWLKGQLISWAKSTIPGPIAKALGIGSPAKVLADQVGHWIPAGVAMGAEDNAGVLDTTMRHLVDVPGLSPARQAGAGLGTARQPQRVLIDVTGTEGAFKTLVSKMVRNDGGGSVQNTFGLRGA